ncbi:MAG: Stp1/IreP family PP2C-type Ser/Thr phosphatase [Acidimicrobiaceae bacterium]
MTRWRFAAATDTGVVRATNQDALHVDNQLAIIADGMGGHAAGEVASEIAVNIVREDFARSGAVEGLHEAIEKANLAIIKDASDNPERFGMGTTVIAVGITYDAEGVGSPTLFNVGDSRAYQLRDGALRQLSDDHSVAEEWVRMGRLTPEEALTHPRRHQLTRALGVEEKLDIDVLSLDIHVGDRILLCSDGLTNELSNEEIARIASSPNSLDIAVTDLVNGAKRAGGNDNISVILLEFDEVSRASNPIKKTVSSAPPPEAKDAQSQPTIIRRRRQFSWRVYGGAGVFAFLIVGFVLIMHWYAYSTFYLANDNGVIGVYQGQVNGVLWFQPQKVLDTTYQVSQLRPADQQALNASIAEPTLNAALNYAAYLHTAWTLSSNSAITSTTVITTTTTKVKKG